MVSTENLSLVKGINEKGFRNPYLAELELIPVQ